jgi:hypothetical protein
LVNRQPDEVSDRDRRMLLLFAARFACHHPLESTGGPPCAGVSRLGR